jgi:hypothetical protein
MAFIKSEIFSAGYFLHHQFQRFSTEVFAVLVFATTQLTGNIILITTINVATQILLLKSIVCSGILHTGL